MYRTLRQRLDRIRREARPGLLTGGQVGVEKESLRVNSQGGIALTPHPPALGSALTHPWITTDYSEALLELITPPFQTSAEALGFLEDIHKFVYDQLSEEVLWATSMPCVVTGDESIPIAEYGSSNVGFMKHVYRRGLGYRYGRPMQAIAGIHFNYSVSSSFWTWLWEAEHQPGEPRPLMDRGYMGMTRNILRFGWLVLYLCGSSPALCKSFVGSEKAGLDEFDRNTWYLPWATSLRMSDIGYQNKTQSGLDISYNSIEEYVRSLTRAIETPFAEYEAIGVRGEDGEWRQLNTNILQIENEYYSIVRPKQVAESGEKPTLALSRRGVRYVELRALDVDPFHPTGITLERALFLEIFLLFCLLQESPPMDSREWRRCGRNQTLTARRGREAGLELHRGGTRVLLRTWAGELCEQMGEIAALLDNGHPQQPYSRALRIQQAVVEEPERAPSARVLQTMRDQRQGFYHFAMDQSRQHERYFQQKSVEAVRHAEFAAIAEQSRADQADIEASDRIPFEAYLQNYFQQ